MRRSAVTAAVVLALAHAAPMAREISKQERDQAVAYLTSTRDQIVAESATLTDAQWNFKAAPDRWSVGEVIEHLALAESFLFEQQQQMMAGPPAPAERRVATQGMDVTILRSVPDRTRKFQTPEPLQPAGRLGSRAETLARFKERRDKTIGYVAATTDDLRSRAGDSPVGSIDGYQWLLFMAAHSDRHLSQLREVKAHPKFPKTKKR